MAVVTIVDETTSGTRTDGWGMEIAEERMTLRELIRRRVFQEAAEFNAAGVPAVGGGLVKALPAARSLNGHHAGWSRRIDPEQQFAIILSKAMLLANDDKITDPDITRQLHRGSGR
jgi:hypothetical protein